MRRRQVLAALGSGALAGCLATPGDSTPSSTQTTTEATGPLPDFGTLPTKRRVVPYSDRGDEPVYVEPGTTRADLPRATLSFVLKNRADEPFMTNPYGWRLWKSVAGKWYDVAPRSIPEPLHRVPSGESHTWTFKVDSAPPIPERNVRYLKEAGTVGGLGPGSYAFSAGGWFEDRMDTERMLTAAFELRGDSFPLYPTPDAELVEQRDDTLVVRESDGTEDGAIVLEPTDDEPRNRLITEEAYQFASLRNTLGFLDEHDAERVKLHGGKHVEAPLRFDPWQPIEYEGRAYYVRQSEN